MYFHFEYSNVVAKGEFLKRAYHSRIEIIQMADVSPLIMGYTGQIHSCGGILYSASTLFVYFHKHHELRMGIRRLLYR